jgi:hypothetical protein
MKLFHHLVFFTTVFVFVCTSLKPCSHHEIWCKHSRSSILTHTFYTLHHNFASLLYSHTILVHSSSYTSILPLYPHIQLMVHFDTYILCLTQRLCDIYTRLLVHFDIHQSNGKRIKLQGIKMKLDPFALQPRTTISSTPYTTIWPVYPLHISIARSGTL